MECLNKYYDEIRKMSSSMTNISLTGWLNQDEITALLYYSHLGICPTSYETPIFPNKAFAYLSAGLPIISSFQGDLKKLIEKEQIGFYYPPNDVDSMVNCIMELYQDFNLYKKMSENAQRIFDEMFDSDKIYKEYSEHIEKVARDKLL